MWVVMVRDIIHFTAPAEDTTESERWEHLLVCLLKVVYCIHVGNRFFFSISERGREDDETAADACVSIS